jgi:cell division protein FtsN
MATERGGLGLGQRLVLLGAWLVSSGFIYVLGVYVGKGMRGGSADITPRVALPVAAAEPEPASGPPDVQSPLTFYDVLGARDGGGTATPPPAAKPSVAAPAAAPSGPSEQRLDVPPEPRALAAAPSGLPGDAAPAPSSPAQAPSAPAASSSPPIAPLPVAADGRWTVYANPTQDRLAVEHERAALRAKGYPAEVVTLRRDGDVWYRIRVGRYATETQAAEASRRLRADGAGHAFVQSE